MSDLALFALASKRLSWLTARQSLVSENIANAHVPGYRARDTGPFAETLARAGVTLAATHRSHLGAGPRGAAEVLRAGDLDNHAVRFSGNNVQLDQELLKSGAIGAEAALGAGVTKAFHRMMLAAAKG